MTTWFTASLLFEAVHTEPQTTPALWEESIVLIAADTEEEAERKAEDIGRREELEYRAERDNHVRWTFRAVQSVVSIGDKELCAGTEVFSRFLRASEASSLLTRFEDE